MDTLVFQTQPVVALGGNYFIETPIILQSNDVPLLQIVRTVSAGFATEIPIYGQDGAYLAKVVGSRIHKGPDADKVGVTLRMPDRRTVLRSRRANRI